MVLGIVTGSMPMIMSLLVMQGITLTMWRSFLDKAIPQLSGDKFRHHQQHVASPGTTVMQIMPGTSESLPMFQTDSSNNPVMVPRPAPPPSTFDQPQADPVTNSLQLLATMDPNMIKLLSQLQTPDQQQEESKISSKTQTSVSATDQLKALNSLASLLQIMQRTNHPNAITSPGGASIMSVQSNQFTADAYDPQNPGTVIQYAGDPSVTPNDQIKYYEISSGSQNPTLSENPDSMREYESPNSVSKTVAETAEGQDENDLDINNNYEYVKPKKSKKTKLIDSNDLFEEVDYDGHPEPDSEGEEDEDREEEEELEHDEEDKPEDYPEYDQEEEDPDEPHPKRIRQRISTGRIFSSSSRNTFLFLKPPTTITTRKRMFGRPRITKRMLKIDSNPFQYAQTKLKNKVWDSILSFPIWKRNSWKQKQSEQLSRPKSSQKHQKASFQGRKLHQTKQTDYYPKKVPTTTKASSKTLTKFSSWKRTSSPTAVKQQQQESVGKFRFVTPVIPILQETKSNKNKNKGTNKNKRIEVDKQKVFDKNNEEEEEQEEEDQDENLNEIPVPSSASLGKSNKKGMINIYNNKKNVQLKTKKITLVDIDEYHNDDNCTIEQTSSKSNKKQFREIWSQKDGWNKCHPKSPAFRISKGIIVPNIVQEQSEMTDDGGDGASSSSTTMTPEDLAEQTTTLPIPEETTTELSPIEVESIMTTTESPSSPASTSTIAPITIPENIFFNILMNLATTPSSVMPNTQPLTTMTTTTSTTPLPPINLNLPKNYLNEVPKDFLFHIMNAINSSQIDTFQMNDDFSMKSKFLSLANNNNNNNKQDVATKDSANENNDIDDEEEEGDDKLEDGRTIDMDLHQIKDDNHVDGKILVAHKFKRVCYYLLNSGKDGQLDINQLELHICSHLIIGYARISTNGLVMVQKPMEDTEKYRRATLLKLQYPKLKVLLSIGDLGGAMFSIVASTNRTRERFILSVLDICDEFNFDGVDIDWEFPGFRTPGSIRDKQNLILLLKELRLKSNQLWNTQTKGQFLISIAVGAPLMIASTSYQIPKIGKFVDFVNLMSYDFHYYRTDKPYTGHHAPLYPRSTDNAYFSTLNVAWTATYWANSGMPLRKIVVGVPTYARTYNLVVPIGQNMINVPASGPGVGKGKLNYTQVCEFLRLPGTMKQYDFHSQVPYAYRGFDWIAYENEMSVAIKAQWVVKTGMGGIVTFALNFDDSKGTCREDGKRFPLQKTISSVLELASIKSYKRSLHVFKIH